MVRRLAAILICAALGGCTIVKVEGARPVRSAHFGTLRLSPEAGAGAVTYRMRGFGLIPGRNSLSLGYVREDAAIIYDPDDCRVVIFQLPSDADARSALLTALGKQEKLCILDRGAR